MNNLSEVAGFNTI